MISKTEAEALGMLVAAPNVRGHARWPAPPHQPMPLMTEMEESLLRFIVVMRDRAAGPNPLSYPQIALLCNGVLQATKGV